MALDPFATNEELGKFWKDIPSGEDERSELLLILASNRLRLMGSDLGTDLDEKIVNNEAFETTLQWVVMESVKRALLTPLDQPPVDTWSQTAGPYSENYKFTNPSGDLWFKKTELSAIGLHGNQKLSSVSSSRTDIYSTGLESS